MAQSIKKQCEALDVYIKGLKEELIRTTDGIEPGAKVVSLAEMKKQDDYDTPTRLMCGDKQDGRGHKASELKAKIIEFKKNITSSLDAGDRAKFQKRLDELFNTDDPKKTEDGKSTWEMANFYHNPVVASVALLTKTQSDIKNAESEMVTHLLTSISATDFKFDTLAPKVIAPSSYVIEGQEYSADIFLAALSSTSDPEISVGGSSLQVASGVGTYKVRASGAGEKKYAGVIKVKKPDNTFEEYKFDGSKLIIRIPEKGLRIEQDRGELIIYLILYKNKKFEDNLKLFELNCV
jgi:gliding motility-associated protein GldM